MDKANYSQGRYHNDGENVPVKLGIYEKSAESFERGCIPDNIGTEIKAGIRKFVLCTSAIDLGVSDPVSGDISALIISGTNAVKTGTTAAPIGGTVIHLDEASFASVTKDQYQGGCISISGGTGIGYTYGISGNTATASTDEIYVYIHDGLVVALSTDSDIEITLPREKDVAIADQAVDFMPIGFTTIAVPAATDIAAGTIAGRYYFWAQTHGPLVTDPDADNTVGQLLMVDSQVGQLIDETAGFHTFGTCLLDGATQGTNSELIWANVQR